MVADYFAGDVQLKEPDKCEGWRWFDWERLENPLFVTFENLKRDNINLAEYF
jgi:8-oxo-dGTP diphosphatase